MELQGGKVILREKRLEDASLDYAWRCDQEISNLDATYPLRMSYQDFLHLYEDQLHYPTPGSGKFGIETQEGKYIGNCMYYDMDAVNKQAEIGIVIGDRGYWSLGYGYDALVTVVDHLFSTAGLKRLYLHTLEWNKRARRAFEKSGFIPVSRVRRAGQNFVLMEIKKDHWLEIREEKLAARDSAAEVSGN